MNEPAAAGSAGRRSGTAEAPVLRADARDAGMREAWLLTETAASWFGAAGWTAVDRAIAAPAVAASVELAIACPDTAVAMRRTL